MFQPATTRMAGGKSLAGGKQSAAPGKDSNRNKPGRGARIGPGFLPPLQGFFLAASSPGAARFALAPGYDLLPLRASPMGSPG